MGKVFFTSDIHFGHENVIRFDGRPFATVEEMDAELIRRWNAKVGNTDTDAVKAAFEALYLRMHSMPLREMDRIVDAVCTLCREHEKAGFVEGVRFWVQVERKIK